MLPAPGSRGTLGHSVRVPFQAHRCSSPIVAWLELMLDIAQIRKQCTTVLSRNTGHVASTKHRARSRQRKRRGVNRRKQAPRTIKLYEKLNFKTIVVIFRVSLEDLILQEVVHTFRVIITLQGR